MSIGGKSMSEGPPKKSVAFFETQFQRQVQGKEYVLNPFETLALDYLKGSVLDFGSGLGNLSLDTIIAIGLLMFLRRQRALQLLQDIQSHINPGGHAIINVLVEGTSYMGMFDPASYYLFGRNEIQEQFGGWAILVAKHETFPGPDQTRKEFSSVIAKKPE